MLAGLKMTAAIAGVFALIIAALWWQLGKANQKASAQRELAGALQALVEHASDVANRNAQQASDLAAEIERRDQIVSDLSDQLEVRRAETQTLMTALQEANRHAPTDYQDCMRIPLPPAVAGLLRVDTRARDPGDL